MIINNAGLSSLTKITKKISTLNLRRASTITNYQVPQHNISATIATKTNTTLQCSKANNYHRNDGMTLNPTVRVDHSKFRFFSSTKEDKTHIDSLKEEVVVKGNNNNMVESNNDDITPSPASTTTTTTSLADEEWAKFEESITFIPSMKDKIESGRNDRKRSSRGGKHVRKRKQKALLREQLNSSTDSSEMDVGGGRFPSLRFSDEETKRLLEEAYANLPPRDGKRGTKNLKRQRNRFESIYKQDAKRKAEKIAAHERTMKKRSQLAKDVTAVLQSAEKIRATEKDYQLNVMQKFAVINGLVKKEEDRR